MMLDLDRGIDTYYKVLALNDDDRSVLLAVDTFYVGDQHRTQLTPTGPFGFDFQMVQSAVFQVRLLASLLSSSSQDGHVIQSKHMRSHRMTKSPIYKYQIRVSWCVRTKSRERIC